jgi:restriction system-associated AAA family ATPase
MLNDLSISSGVREQYKKSVQERRFMTRLPEPQDDDKVFRFERILLKPIGEPTLGSVDYVSLSDGEHQQAQVLGIFNLVEQKNALFLFDEPESHFNPKWRIKFAEGLTKLVRNASGSQEFLLTTHSPFVPSDMHRENVLVFGKNEDGKVKVTEPAIETFGTSFDDILAHCFDIQPAISTLARKRIEELKNSESIDEIKDAMQKLGSSTEKIVLFDRLRQLEKGS